MEKEKKPLTYFFINPNPPKAVEALLREILIEQLLRLYRENRPAFGTETGDSNL